MIARNTALRVPTTLRIFVSAPADARALTGIFSASATLTAERIVAPVFAFP